MASNTNRHSLTVLRMDKLSWVFLTWDPSYSYSEMVAEAGVFWKLSYLHDCLLGWEGWNSWGLAPHLFLTGAFPHGWVGFLYSQTFYVVVGLPPTECSEAECKSSSDLALEVTQCHFYHVLLIKMNHRGSPALGVGHYKNKNKRKFIGERWDIFGD